MCRRRALELGRAGRWAEAAGLLARCGRTGPLSRELAQAWGIACLRMGDQAGYREASAAVSTRDWPDPIVAWDATQAGSLLALGSGGLDDYHVPISWFEKRLANGPVPPPIYRPYYFPNALGALLIRAGRLDEAIARLNEGMAAAKEAKCADHPTDWAYLALAHARKGNVAESRRWLERLRLFRPATTTTFWDLQELALLQTKATPAEVDEYRRFIVTLAQHVAAAHREHGKDVSDAEQAAIDEIAAALGAPAA